MAITGLALREGMTMFIKRLENWPFDSLGTSFSELGRLRRDLDQLMGFRMGPDDGLTTAGVFPLLNVSQDHDNFYVRSEIPGLTLDELDVSVTGRSLTISGERKIPTEDQQVRYHRREREAGKFRRQLNLPSDVNSEKVQAKYRHGILMMVLPKAESAKPKKISISV